jgi:hypothetical protein
MRKQRETEWPRRSTQGRQALSTPVLIEDAEWDRRLCDADPKRVYELLPV